MPFQYGSDRHIRGIGSENKFRDIMTNAGHNVIKSTYYEDKYQHTDFHIDGKRYDVKGLKRVLGQYTDKKIWVEVRGSYHKGWLYSEHVDYFAFENMDGSFSIISKTNLQKVIKEMYSEPNMKVTSDISVIANNQRLYYYARGAKNGMPAAPNERVVLINKKDILDYIKIVK